MTKEKFKEMAELSAKLEKREAVAKIFESTGFISVDSGGPFVDLDQELIDAIRPVVKEQLEKYRKLWEDA